MATILCAEATVQRHSDPGTVEVIDSHGQMVITANLRDGAVAITLSGRVLDDLGRQADRALLALLADHASKPVILDLAACDQLSSASVSWLVRLLRHCSSEHREVVAVQPSHRVGSLLHVLGIDGILLVVEDWDTGIAYLRAQGL